MPIDNDSLECEPVDTGDMSDIPPDLPEGTWVGTIQVKLGMSSSGSHMATLEITATESETAGNEEFVGAVVYDYVLFYPANHKNAKFGKRKAKQISEALDISLPDTSSLKEGSWSSLGPWVEALEADPVRFFTTVAKDKKSGEEQTRVHWSDPRAKKGKKLEAPKPGEEEEEEEEETESEKPAKGTKGKPAAPAKKGKK